MLFQYLKYFVEYQKFALSGAVGSREAEKANASPRPSKIFKGFLLQKSLENVSWSKRVHQVPSLKKLCPTSLKFLLLVLL